MKHTQKRILLSCIFLFGCGETALESQQDLPGVFVTEDATQANRAAAVKEIVKPEVVTNGPLPKAVAEDTEFNFGRMALGSKSKTTFEIRNEGETDLQLKAGEPTCQCTQFSLSKETVLPGESSTLTVRWDAKKVDRAFQHGGPVYTNDSKREEIRFVVMGIVGIDYELQPTEIWNAGEVHDDSPATVSGVLFSSIDGDFEIDHIETEVDYVNSDFRKLTVPELAETQGIAGYRIRVDVDPKFGVGEVKHSVDIYIKGREEPIKTIVAARRVGPIKVLPTPGVMYSKEDQRLRFGDVPSETGKDVTVLLLVHGLDEPLQLTDIKSVPAFVTAELKSIGKDFKRYRLKISLPKGIQQGLRNMKNPVRLTLKTNHPEQKAIEFNITYRSP